MTKATVLDGICRNANPGTFNHECGKLAEWIGARADGRKACFCGTCKADGAEARAYGQWQPLPRAHALNLRWVHADSEWSKELTKLFGARAGDVRYTDEGKGAPSSYLRFLYTRFWAFGTQYRECSAREA